MSEINYTPAITKRSISKKKLRSLGLAIQPLSYFPVIGLPFGILGYILVAFNEEDEGWH